MAGLVTRSLGVIVAVTGLLGATSCGGSDSSGVEDVATATPEEFAATPEYLASVAERSAGESYRFEMWMTSGGGDPTGPPLISGAVDGQSLTQSLNFSTALGATEGAPVPDVQMVRHGPDRAYMHVPFLLDAPDSALDPETRELKRLLAGRDGWLLVEPSQILGADPEEMGITGDPSTQDPSAMIDVIAGAKGASELGTREINGEEMTGIEAQLTFSDLLAADGLDPDTFADTFMDSMVNGMADAQGLPPEAADQIADITLEVMTNLTLPSDVWVDRDGLLRRFSYTLDMSAMLREMADRLGETPPPPGMIPGMRYTIDLSGYGEDMDIQAPADALDLTDRPELFDYWKIMGLLQGGPAGIGPGPGPGPGSEI